jgi:putative CocE/NonD family hydrolase
MEERAMASDIAIEFDVPAPMRDGTLLRANIVRPQAGGPYPVVLMRTPYGKDFAAVSPLLDSVRLARAGYIVVTQDTRGRFGSQGEWEPFRYEADDGYDSVEWAARLSGCTGAVGMVGGSYVGFTQWAAAGQRPPSLRALVPAITWDRADNGVFFRGGATEWGVMTWWQLGALGLDVLMRRMHGAPPQELADALVAMVRELDQLPERGYQALPIAALEPLRRHGLGGSVLEALAAHGAPSFISPLPDQAAYERIAVPALNVGGWYDLFLQSTLNNFFMLREHGGSSAARAARLLIGPWSHVNWSGMVGEVDFGFAAGSAFMNLQTDLTGLTQRWFDYWLKGVDNGVPQDAPVRIFVMGANRWRDEQTWPLPQARATPLYLRAGAALHFEAPGDEAPDQYTYDPRDPTPTLGGALLMHASFIAGARDQRPLEARDDLLSYTSAPLETDLTVVGPVSARLWVASDAPDTDFVARLIDVRPDGFACALTDGILRMRYREGASAAGLEPGRPYEITIDLWSTANMFRAGHRIRVDIASASFPRWDRNLNTADADDVAAMRPARQTILHDAAHPSQIVLPVLPADA